MISYTSVNLEFIGNKTNKTSYSIHHKDEKEFIGTLIFDHEEGWLFLPRDSWSRKFTKDKIVMSVMKEIIEFIEYLQKDY